MSLVNAVSLIKNFQGDICSIHCGEQYYDGVLNVKWNIQMICH